MGGLAQVRFQETQSSNSPAFIHYWRGSEDLRRRGRDKGVQEMNQSRGATEAPCDSAAVMKRGTTSTVALLSPDGPHAAPWVSRHCRVATADVLVSFSSGQTSSKIRGHDPASDQIMWNPRKLWSLGTNQWQEVVPVHPSLPCYDW